MKNERKEGKKALESRKTHCLAAPSSHFHQLQTNHSPFISQLSLLLPPPLIKTLFQQTKIELKTYNNIYIPTITQLQ